MRRSVSTKKVLPPSIKRSPALKCGRRSAITASTALPAGTMISTRRGVSRCSTNSATVRAAFTCLPLVLAAKLSTFLGSRSKPTTENPRLSMLRARFSPITPSPTIPKLCFAMIVPSINPGSRIARPRSTPHCRPKIPRQSAARCQSRTAMPATAATKPRPPSPRACRILPWGYGQ